MRNKAEDLRNHLFEVLEGLKDKENPMEVDRARAVADVAHAIINSAKVELAFMKQMNAQTSSFLPAGEGASNSKPGNAGVRRLGSAR